MVVPAKRGNQFSGSNSNNKSNKSDHIFHEPPPSSLPANGQRFGNQIRCKSFFAMATAPDKKKSLDLLRRLFSLVKPVMAKHNFSESKRRVYRAKEASWKILMSELISKSNLECSKRVIEKVDHHSSED